MANIFTAITDYFDAKRDREVQDINRKMRLAQNRLALTQLYRTLVNEKKRRSYDAEIFGADDGYTEICEDIQLVRSLLDRSERYTSTEQFVNEDREDLAYLLNKYRHYLR